MNLEIVKDASTGSAWQNLEVLKLEECHSELVSESHQNKWDVEINLEIVEDASTGSEWQNLELRT